MNFTQEEKKAILRLIYEIADADSKVEFTELKFISTVTKRIEFDLSNGDNFKNVGHKEAINIAKSMESAKKAKFKELIYEMAKIDNRLPLNETRKILEIIHEGEIDDDF